MGLWGRYRFYKRGLQLLLFINVIFICIGCVAGFHFFQTNDVNALQMFLVGFGVLIFGLLLPGYFLYRTEKKMQKMRQQIYTHLSNLAGIWVESNKGFEGEIYKNPMFWGNMALMAIEEIGPSIDHPLMNILLEFSPYIRKEIKKQAKHESGHHGSKKVS